MNSEAPLSGVEPVLPLEPRVTYGPSINGLDLFDEKTTTGRMLRPDEFIADPVGLPPCANRAARLDKMGQAQLRELVLAIERDLCGVLRQSSALWRIELDRTASRLRVGAEPAQVGGIHWHTFVRSQTSLFNDTPGICPTARD